MKLLKIITTSFYSLIAIAVTVLAISVALSLIEAPGGIRLFVIQSGSMEPALSVGTLVITVKQPQYQDQEIITFKNNESVDFKKDGATTTHRIVEVKTNEDNISYVTKGDANESVDRELVSASRVLGKVQFTVPKLGLLINFAKTQLGFLILVIIPGVIIIVNEINTIKRETFKLIKKWLVAKSSKKDKKEEKVDEK